MPLSEHQRRPQSITLYGTDDDGRAVSFDLVIERQCGQCSGRGILEHPLWIAFYADFARMPRVEARRVYAEQWFARSGSAAGEVPPLVVCAACRGGGYVLTDNARALGQLLRQIAELSEGG